MSAYGGVFSESAAAPLWTAGIGAGLAFLGARGALTLAFSLAGVEVWRLWERGRPARASRASARLTLTLALSRKGRGDPMASIRT